MLKNVITFLKQRSLFLMIFGSNLFSVVFWLLFPGRALAANGESFVGKINPPPGVDKYQSAVGDDNIGLIVFLSNIIRLVTIVAGVWTMFNVIFAGWIYLTSSGDASAHEKVSSKLINSVIGLALVAFAYTIAAAVGFIIFGDAGYIINPDITTINDL